MSKTEAVIAVLKKSPHLTTEQVMDEVAAEYKLSCCASLVNTEKRKMQAGKQAGKQPVKQEQDLSTDIQTLTDLLERHGKNTVNTLIELLQR